MLKNNLEPTKQINSLEFSKDQYFKEHWKIDGLSDEKSREIFELCFNLSFSDNHSDGLSEVFNALYDYRDLVTDIVKILKK